MRKWRKGKEEGASSHSESKAGGSDAGSDEDLSDASTADMTTDVEEDMMKEAITPRPSSAWAFDEETEQPAPGEDTAEAVPSDRTDDDDEDEDDEKKKKKVPRICCGIQCGMKKPKKKYVSLLRIYMVNPSQIPLLVTGALAAFGRGIVLPGFAIIFGQIFKTFTGDEDNIKENAAIIAYAFLGLGAFMAFVSFIETLCFVLVGENVCKTLRIRLFNAIMHKDVEFFDHHQTGELTSRLSGDIVEVQGGISDKIGQIIAHMSSVAMGIGVAFYYGWKLTLVLLGLAPLLVVAGAVQALMLKISAKNGRKAFVPATNLAEEAIGGFKTVLAFVMEDVLVGKYGAFLKKPTSIGRRRSLYMAAGMSFSFFVMFGAYALGFWYGGQLVAEQEMDLGDLLIVFFSIVIGAVGLGQAGQLFPDVTKARAAATEIFHIINVPITIDPRRGSGIKLEEMKGELSFNHVQFSYPSRKKALVFSDLDLTIPAGEKLALVGPSGGGKSSVIALSMRFYDTLAGSVEIDGVDIKDFDLTWLRGQIGLVAQEPILFSCSIAENILYGKQDATQEEIVEAAKMANAHNFIMKLPQGYQTLIGEKGCRLSGGQKQRIAIARAVLKNPKILLLDEATSALDTESESLVQQALNKLMKGRTSVVIAHRLATIKDAHTIAVMEAGSIVEMGTHVDLLNNGGVYSHLVNRQLTHDGSQSRNVSLRRINVDGPKQESKDRVTHSRKLNDSLRGTLKLRDVVLSAMMKKEEKQKEMEDELSLVEKEGEGGGAKSNNQMKKSGSNIIRKSKDNNL